MSRWLLIDGFNLAYRCFFATPLLTRSDGFPTNALHGWVKSLWRLMDQERPDNMVVFFDLGGSDKRLLLHPSYKAQRQEMPDNLKTQIQDLKIVTRLMGLSTVELQGVESDDLLASCAVGRAAQGDEICIVSSDKDFAQIVNDRIRVLLPPPSSQPKIGWRSLDVNGVVSKFGVTPSQIADYLSLIGDTSDNIPGLLGVGPKTAVNWLTRYGDLESVIANANYINPERFRTPLLESADRLRLNRRLIKLDLDLQLPLVIQSPPDIDSLIIFFLTMEMKTTSAEAVRRYTQAELF